jgi:hypothetical protein
VIIINSLLIATLGLLYLFAQPTRTPRRGSRGLTVLGGVVVAVLSAYFATQVGPFFSWIFWILSGAVLVKTYLNLRGSMTRSGGGD